MKKFLIIGSANAITYKEIFPYIASGEWFIRTANGKISFVMYFTNSEGEIKKVPSVWFTNLDSRHLYKTLELTKTYDPEKYPHYDNYDAIEVSRIKDIPYDYDGVMGVPISIVLFSPYQFSIVDSRDYAFRAKDINEIVRPYVDGKEIYRRVLNQNSNPLAPGEVSAYVDNHKKFCRVFNKNSDVHNPLAGGLSMENSLLKEYQSDSNNMQYNKKFLIIGNMNAITYKEIFPLIKNNKVWMGVSFNKSKWFKVPDDYKKMDNASGYKEENGEKHILVNGIAWFTNMEHNKRNGPLILTKKYDPALYPKYDNYDAIEVSKTCDIPLDYYGVMGVPISFLDKYCPTQFEIIDINPHFFSIIEKGLPKPKQLTLHNIGQKDPYARILIRRKI